MPLFAKSEQEMIADSLQDLASNTNITRLSAGGIARSLVESMNRRLANAYDTFDLNLARSFVSSAPGQYLELIGTLLAVERESPAAAAVNADTEVIKFYVASGTFGTINNNNDFTLSRGTIISSEVQNSGIRYRLTEDVPLLSTASLAWASAEAVIPGEESNIGTGSLQYHDFVSYTDYLNETLLVTNVHPIANGKNFESDDNYRYRIVNRVLEAEAANETAIRLAVLSTPGVADVIILRRYRGIGTFGVIIKTSLPTVSQSVLDAVTANVEQTMALGDVAYVRKPFETGLAIELTIHYSQRLPDEALDLIEESLRTEITSNINSLDIGEAFYVNKLISELFAISDNIANFGVAGKPIDKVYIYKESQLRDNRVRSNLLGDHIPESDERVIMEPTLTQPITITRAFVRR